MNCRHAGDLLSPYLEGELSPRRASALEEHLHGCEGCRAEFALLRRAVAVLQTPPALVRPEGLLQEFRQRLEAAPPRRSLFPRLAAPWPVLVPAGAVAAVLVGVAVLPLVSKREAPRSGRPVATQPGAAPSTRMAQAPKLSFPQEGALSDRATPPASGSRMEATRRESAPAVPGAGGNPGVVEDMRESVGGRSPGTIVGRASTTRPPTAVSPDVLPTSGDLQLRFRPSAAEPKAQPHTVPLTSKERSRRNLAPQRLLLPPGVEPPRPSSGPVKLARGRPQPNDVSAAGLGGAARRDDSPTPTTTPPPAESLRLAEREAGVTRSWVALYPGAPSAFAAPGLGALAPGGPPPAAPVPPSESGEQRVAVVAQAPATSPAPTVDGARRQTRLAKATATARGVPPALVAALQRPVNVVVQDVPLADLLQQLGKSAGVPVLLTTPTPETRRAHAELQGITLYEALQKVAETAGLIIAPQGAGVGLRPRTAAEAVTSHPSVWSRDWARLPETLSTPRAPASDLQR